MHRHNLFHEHAAKRGSDDDLPSISKALDPMNPLGVLSPSNSPNPDDGNSNEKPTPVATSKPSPETTMKPEPKPKTTAEPKPQTTEQPKPQTTQNPQPETTLQPATHSSSTSNMQATPSTFSLTSTPVYGSSTTQSIAVASNVRNQVFGSGSSTTSASATATPAVHHSHGLSPGGKAGLAVGLIAFFGLIGAAAFFIIRRKRRVSDVVEIGDEKTVTTPNSERFLPPAPPAPVLPPVTLVSDADMKDAGAETRGSVCSDETRSLTDDHQPKSNPFDEVLKANSNPFANPAVTTGPKNSGSPNNGHVSPDGSTRSITPEESVTMATTGTAVSVGSMESGSSVSPPVSNDRGLTSPTPSESAAIGGANVGAGPVSGFGVHRVQLDFTPTMDDELALNAGQLVRVLHEYDDGWSLCVRLDGSQRGVAPRACLSAHPLKPRPREAPSGPPGPGRPMSPASRPPGPNTTVGAPPRPISTSKNGGYRPYPGLARPASPANNGGYRPYPGSFSRPASPARYSTIPRTTSPGPRSMNSGPKKMA